ncbi:MAG: GNAT family N-acetyltransferase [Actinomycetota bacterium]|nr:GNAT family N-acetyltransferase [Actinomycetota bacterium]
MREELARAYAFLARGDMGGTRTVASPYGRAVYTDELPRRLDGNYLWVEREAGPEELVAEAQRLQRRLIYVPDPILGDRLAPWFADAGWRIDRHLVMAQLREPEREADLSLVHELDEEALRPARRRLLESEPWATPEVVEQLFAAKALIGERVTTRFFGVPVNGEVASFTDLYVDGADAQIEHVGTLPEHRGRGYATAVILAAIAKARESGAGFVFLVADAEDWPKELYRRLGFDELGHYTKFFAPPA